MRRRRRKRVLWAYLALAVSVAFGVYLFTLYQQLKHAFAQQEQFIPTQIYSDVTEIAPPQPFSIIEDRLKALGYSYTPGSDDVRTLTFKLHRINYPAYLIPENDPTFTAADNTVVLKADGNDKNAVLQTVLVNGNEIPHLYLEPELIATLARSGEATREIRAPLEFQDIPAAVWKAIIAVEDQHFLEHGGFDPRGLARAILVNLKSGSFAQGGSTITQQLVKNLMARRNKNLFRKVNELFLAIILETQFEKEEILERYLNEVYLGQVGSLEVHGVAEGAKHFFGKNVDELNLAEIALMAGLIRGPGYYSPYRQNARAMERQRLVLKKMVETGQIAQAEADAASRMPIRLAPPKSATNKAPYFADFVKAEIVQQMQDKFTEEELTSNGFKVYTTLDSRMNSVAQNAVSQGIADLEKRLKIAPTDRLEGALAAVDHSNGYVRALIGGRSYSQSTFNRILNMRRQVGSTFKPIVYLAALAKGVDAEGVAYGPGHPAEDAPWKYVYDEGRQTWTPRNYEKGHLGWINFRTALAHSVNTVAAKLGVEVGLDEITGTAEALGIKTELPEVPSLSLGVAELTPVELLRAYAAIANHGVQDELTVIRAIIQNDGSSFARFVYEPRQVFPAAPIDLLTDMLQSVFTEGTARHAYKLGFDRPAAGKTGTTSQYRDAWFAGYTPQLTAVVWVGTDQAHPKKEDGKKKPKLQLTGASAALPIWVNFMKAALAGNPPAAFAVNPDLGSYRIDRRSGKLAEGSCPDAQTIVEKYWTEHPPSDETCETVWPQGIRESLSH